jgi:predicted aspartyl protease
LLAWICLLHALSAAAVAEPHAYGSQPLIRLANGRPGVLVAVNGYGLFPFLVDTATSNTVLTPQLRDRLRIPSNGGDTLSVVTAAGTVRSQFHLVKEIATAGVIVERVDTVVMDLPASLGAAGILGADFLSNFTVDLDPGRRLLMLYPGGSVVQPPGFERVAGTVNSSGFIIAAGRVDNVTTSFVFDSGAALSVANVSMARRAQRGPKIIARNIVSKVVDAVQQRGDAESLNFRRLTLGPASWSDRRVLIARMHVFEQVGLDDTPTIFIGADLMAGRRVILDYGNSALYLAR